ncbi:ABC-2 type transport system ATP-binding protein [Catalinimonas alkaloidigena]|uniref:ABC-2 type transport system ATP-binding protein n=1 Tax=Catalinimonas alkaloidigena TaxID=1075417 RepID=A0A1G9GBF8_9BACT|nr:gliding motility-associated ABC transporter ATP-binding subunit GldA [Catalinimonas alkaloidigena]SDK98009.1 ABC-2 type transport system ATP-binding protein [Catalinimonas alkaloidigena]
MSVVVDQLVKTYGSQHAVDHISFRVETGDILGFLGPNGAGKSTTMKIATCYLPPTSGLVTLNGFNVETQPTEVRRQVGYLPEHNPLYLDLYVHEYLRFVAGIYGLRGQTAKKRAADMVELTGLGREQHKKIGALSKGYRQRVGLAQALIHDPSVLILDEPTTGLDPNQILEIRNLIREVGKEKTVIFSTHILPEVQALCNRVVIINRGKLVADSPVEALRGGSTIQVEFEQAIDETVLAQLPGIRDVRVLPRHRYELLTEANQDLRGAVFRLAAERSWPLVGLQRQENSMEEVFRELTAQTPAAQPQAE